MTLDTVWGTLRGIWKRVSPIDCADWACGGFRDLSQLPPEVQNSVRDSYPSNHNFTADEDRLIPSRQLAHRVRHFRTHYLQPVRSLLDLSCSRGFFLFDAAQEPTCERVLGLDLCDQTLDVCRQLLQHYDRPQRVSVAKLTLAELADRIDEFGGPFETVLLVNTYQYLFFGSSISPALSHDHCEIFRLIRKVCQGRVIFHNRITFDRVQKHVRDAADGDRWRRIYTPEAIRASASEFFRVTETPVWGGHPVWLLDAK